MAWFRRRRSATVTDSPDDIAPDATPGAAPAADVDGDGDRLPVRVASAPQLERTERALRMLAVQSSQLHSCIVQLEHRVDALSEAMLGQLDRPTFDDLMDARMHSAKVASELSRLEINVAARLESVRDEIRVLRHGVDGEIDLRDLTPADTGF